MNTNEFINKFYTDKEYQKQIIHDVKEIQSKYDRTELLEHQKVLDDLYDEILFNKINNEIYPQNTQIFLEAIDK